MSEAEQIEYLIWKYNESLISASEAWLRENRSGDDVRRMAMLSTPAAYSLPLSVDDVQLQRRISVSLKISKRLGQQDVALGQLIVAMEWTERAGTAAGFLLGGGMVVVAYKKAGAWGITKAVAMMGASYIADHVIDEGLRAAGASEETIQGVRLAAAAVTFIIAKKKLGAAGKEPPAQAGGRPQPRPPQPANQQKWPIAAAGAVAALRPKNRMKRGWLRYWEGRGVGNSRGHVIAEHVGKSDGYLKSRLSSNKKISAASSFTDQATAETVIGGAIRRNRVQLKEWLRTAQRGDRLRLRFAGPDVIGRGIKKGESFVGDRKKARIVLQALGNGKYHILTAFPE